MLVRFSLYGFLKNQRYFEPFLFLIFLEKGLSYFAIGVLIGFRELCLNLMEIPSGALADLYGRRRTMIAAFVGYVISFVVFALSHSFWALMGAMFCFAMGDAFRSGTHKAMIFDWLAHEGRLTEKTKVYGFTRSWSKMGSALSVVIAAGMVFYSGQYSHIFWFSIPPYVLGIINFFGYPAYLDGARRRSFSGHAVWSHFKQALHRSWQDSNIRRLIVESMGFEGLYKSVKDYLQPVIQHLAVTLPLLVGVEDTRRTALMVGGVYFVLHVLSGIASRRAYRLRDRLGSEENAAKWLWQLYGLLFLILTFSFSRNMLWVAILCFTGMAIAQNMWRPILVSRFDDHAPAEESATILSIESQSKSLATILLAPLLGYAVDQFSFLPLGICGIAVSSLIGFQFYRR